MQKQRNLLTLRPAPDYCSCPSVFYLCNRRNLRISVVFKKIDLRRNPIKIRQKNYPPGDQKKTAEDCRTHYKGVGW